MAVLQDAGADAQLRNTLGETAFSAYGDDGCEDLLTSGRGKEGKALGLKTSWEPFRSRSLNSQGPLIPGVL